MLADPQSITHNTVATSLPAISRGDNKSVYKTSDGQFQLTVGHEYKPNRNRFVVRLDQLLVSEDPYNTALNKPFSTSVYLVVDAPVIGMTTGQVVYQAQALVDYLDGSGLLTKVIGGET